MEPEVLESVNAYCYREEAYGIDRVKNLPRKNYTGVGTVREVAKYIDEKEPAAEEAIKKNAKCDQKKKLRAKQMKPFVFQ